MTALCVGRNPEWWSSTDDGARLALSICGRCTDCPDTDPRPAGVIRQGVAYSDLGRPLPVCPSCAYPVPNRSGVCLRCAAPTLGRWKPDMVRWRIAGVSDAAGGRVIGATAKEVRDTRRPRRGVRGLAAA